MFDDGNGMYVNADYCDTPTTRPGCNNSVGKNSLPLLNARGELVEELSLLNTPIYSLLIFRRLSGEPPRNQTCA